MNDVEAGGVKGLTDLFRGLRHGLREPAQYRLAQSDRLDLPYSRIG
ncbi:hypothetical protein G3N59_26300 [Paraburkholderia sp. Ac-20340]|nr:hypothetical protein [Paraburkholderia sp. Ac-20340]MBN3856897.1 hypothetical protein [Paraburkholderia sp. Ac-20340]